MVFLWHHEAHLVLHIVPPNFSPNFSFYQICVMYTDLNPTTCYDLWILKFWSQSIYVLMMFYKKHPHTSHFYSWMKIFIKAAESIDMVPHRTLPERGLVHSQHVNTNRKKDGALWKNAIIDNRTEYWWETPNKCQKKNLK